VEGHLPARRERARGRRSGPPHERADEDVERRPPAQVDEAERAREEPAAFPLEARDRRHRRELRRAGDRSAGEERREEVDRVDAGPRSPDDVRRQVVDRRVGLEVRVALDDDAAGLADAAEVVPLEVDDHRELGAVLPAREERAREALVLLGRRAARRRALDRPRARAPHVVLGVVLEKELGRGGEQRAAFEAQVAHVRRRVPLAEAQVQVDRIALDGAREAVREVRLVEVPRRDERARSLDPRAVLRGRHVAHQRAERARRRRDRRGRAQQVEDLAAADLERGAPVAGVVAEHEPGRTRDRVLDDEVDVHAAGDARRAPGIRGDLERPLARDAEVVGERAQEPAVERPRDRVALLAADAGEERAQAGDLRRRLRARERVESDEAEAARRAGRAVERDEARARAQPGEAPRDVAPRGSSTTLGRNRTAQASTTLSGDRRAKVDPKRPR
jgi:hypothetical protein